MGKSFLVEVQGHKIYLDPKDKGVATHLLKYGSYEEEVAQIFYREIKQGMTVLDIGAHIGYFTLIAAKLVGEKGKVFAFEPEPTNLSFLLKNIEVNGYKNIIPVPKAVSDETGKTLLFLSPDNTGDHRIYSCYDDREFIEVETTALDEFFKGFEDKIDFIKMDIQGAEMKALRGMTEVMRRNKSLKMVVEFWPFGLKRCGSSPEEFLNEIRRNNFQIHLIKEDGSTQPIDDPSAICPQGMYLNLFLKRE